MRPHWIVGRDLCLYRCEDLSNVPRNRRRAALRLKVPVWSPFQRTGWHCVWAGATAMTWFWDEDAVQVRADAFAAPVERGGVRIRPETTFLPRRANGPRLARCRNGWDLQCWREGALRDSRWFADRPSNAELAAPLQRQGFDLAALEADAAAAASAHAPEPWGSRQTPGEWLAANERRLVAAGLLAFALAAAWQEARFWKIERSHAAAAAELAAIERDLGPLAGARGSSVRLRRRNDALTQILNTPSQARVMSLIDELIPSESARFYEWRYQQGELAVVVEDDAGRLDTVAYVQALERQPLFEDVRVGRSRDNNRVEISLRVRA